MTMWKKISGFEDYEISNTGIVRRGGMVVRPYDNGLGYLQIKLWNNRKMKRKYIHRLVMENFRPIDGNKFEVNHIDHDKKNNNIWNLEWVTHKENLRKAVCFLGADKFTANRKRTTV